MEISFKKYVSNGPKYDIIEVTKEKDPLQERKIKNFLKSGIKLKYLNIIYYNKSKQPWKDTQQTLAELTHKIKGALPLKNKKK